MRRRSSEAPKRGAGRPPVATGGTRKVSITLDPATLAALEQLGDGNLSAGVREAVRVAKGAAAAREHAERAEDVTTWAGLHISAINDALRPFAALLQRHNESGPDDRPVFAINDAVITLGDLRRAVAALQRAGR